MPAKSARDRIDGPIGTWCSVYRDGEHVDQVFLCNYCHADITDNVMAFRRWRPGDKLFEAHECQPMQEYVATLPPDTRGPGIAVHLLAGKDTPEDFAAVVAKGAR